MRRAELAPLLHVAGRDLERALRQPDGLRTDDRAGRVERTHRVLEPSALLADQLVGGHHRVFEHELTRRRAPHAHLVLELPDGEPGRVAAARRTR